MRRSLLVPFLLAAAPCAQDAPAPGERLARLPLAFEPRPGGGYAARGPGYAIAVDAAGATVRHAAGTLRLSWAGGNRGAKASAEQLLAGRSHYLLGPDPDQWRRDVPRYGRVRHAAIYRGVDAVWYGNQGRLEFDAVVAPGADPAAIRLRVAGAERVEVAETGELLLGHGPGALRLQPPAAYQTCGGATARVRCRYAVDQGGLVGFELGDYDAALPLVIDPVLTFGTFLGGSGADRILAYARDAEGSHYLAGFTTSADFPIAGGVQTELRGIYDIFVTKLDATGSQLVYSTYLGGTGEFGDDEWAEGIAVDGLGRAVVLGRTENADFPVQNAFQPTPRGGIEAVVFALDPSGSQLVYSTFLGGSGDEIDFDLSIGRGSGDVVIDTAGFAVVAGFTDSADLPVLNARQPQFGGRSDGFVARFDPAGQPAYVSYLGGSSGDEVRDLELGPQGSVFLAGSTSSPEFPTTPGAYSRTAFAGFVTRMEPVAQTIESSTVFPLGVTDVGIDPSGDAYLAGTASSSGVPTTLGAHQVEHGGSFMSHRAQVWVAKLDQDLGRLAWATYFGSPTDNESAVAVVADAFGHAYLSGSTSEHFGTRSEGAFLLKLNAVGSEVVYTRPMASRDAEGGPLLLERAGAVWSTGTTWSPVGFSTPGAVQPVHGGNRDGFLGRVVDQATSLRSLTILGSRLGTGESVVAAVTMDGAAPPGGLAVQIQSSDPAAVVPASIAIPEGSATGLFTVTGAVVSQPVSASITATVGGAQSSADVVVWPGPLYRVTPIFVAGRGNAEGNGINAFGDIAGTVDNQSFRFTAQQGLEVLGVGRGLAINDNGQVAGGNGVRAFRFTEGIGRQLLGVLPGGEFSEGRGINARGDVCGISDTVEGILSTARAFLFTDALGLRSLGSLGIRSEADGINRHGHSTGTVQISGRSIAFVHTPEGGMTPLGTLPGLTNSAGEAINDFGQVTGRAAAGLFTVSRMFLWTPGSGFADLGTLPGGASAAGRGLNSFGHVVGFSERQSSSDNFAVIHDGTQLTAFEDVVSATDAFEWELSAANGINDQGQIVGTGNFRGNGSAPTAFRLEPAFFPPYGAGCRGTAAKIPGLMGTGYPTGGSRIQLWLSGPAGATAAILVSAQRADVPLLGCQLLLGAPLFDLTGSLALGAAGATSVPIVLPAGVPGGSVFLQGVVLDPGAPSGLLAFSNGVEMKIPAP